MKEWALLITGIVLCFAGVALGLYVGIWVMLAGGIMQIIEATRMPVLESTPVAIGTIKILFSGFVGFFCMLIVGLLGKKLIDIS